MTEIKITIDAPGLSEAINNLAEALKKPVITTVGADSTIHQPLLDNPVELPETKAEAPENPTTAPATNVASGENNVTTTVPSAQAPSPAEVKDTAPAKKETSKKHEYSLAELSAAGAELMDAGKMQDLMNLIASFGVQAITQLPADKYPELADGLKALGAKFKD